MSDVRTQAVENLKKESQALERPQIEYIVFSQLQKVYNMHLLSLLEKDDGTLYYGAVSGLTKMCRMFATEDFLKEINGIEESFKKDVQNLSNVRKERIGEVPKNWTWKLDLYYFADKLLDACLRLLQVRGMGMTMVGKEESFGE